ncbi:MAG: enoyl-CoA hydratase-related protein [Thermodesulfobacteriota bacterium]
MQSYKTLLVEDRGPVRLITLNQPQLFNPLDQVSGPELIQALEAADREPAVRALVLTGAGKAYAAGGNVRFMAEILAQGERPGPWFSEVGAVLNRSVITLRRLTKPVVCALNGVVAGGGLGWCLGCDLVVAAQGARLDPGYIRIAVCPDGGASALVTRLIGHKRASEFFLLGRALSAQEALQWGLVNRVVADDHVLEEALTMAGQLAQAPRQALAATKALLNQAVLGDLETILEEERQDIMRLADQPDFAEGIQAFFEKRKPDFA